MESTDEEDLNPESAELKQVKTERGTSQKNPEILHTSTRLMRNLAEKMRRDKLNMHITQLASIVPIVSMAPKRIDKTSVLRLSAAYLRINQNLLNEKSQMSWKPCFFGDGDLSNLLLEAVNGFLLILSLSGKVIYVSDEIEKTLGHSPVDIIGHSIFNILHADDYSLVQENLQTTPKFENERRSFYCRLSERTLSRSDCGKYDLVHVLGHIRMMKQPSNGSTNNSNTNNGNNNKNEPGSNVKENLMVCVVRQTRNQQISEISWMDGCQNEYITQHALDGRIECADHRISLITGHTPEEVCGKNAYDFIFAKDIPIATLAHREIFTNHTGLTTTIYRLWTRSRKLIYLKTQGKIQRNCVTQKVDTFLCVNKLLSEEQGRLELHQLQMRFIPSVNHSSDCDTKCEHAESPIDDALLASEEEEEEEEENVNALTTMERLEEVEGTDGKLILKMRMSLMSLMKFLKTSVDKSARSMSSSSSVFSDLTPRDQIPTSSVVGTTFRRSASLSESSGVEEQFSFWSKESTSTMSVSSTTRDSQQVIKEEKSGEQQIAECSSTATVLSPINVEAETSKNCASSSSSSQNSSALSETPAVIGRKRTVKNVMGLPACHTPSHGDVERMLEHRAHSNITPVPLKRRCSKAVQPGGEPAQPLSKRGRGRPRQNSC